jgi:hypothetical protein
MEDLQALFPQTYEASRERFRKNLTVVRKQWPKAELFQHHIADNEDLTIDWIYSDALEANDKALLFTTGEHGVEGYVGSAMQQCFIDGYLPRLDPRNTGLLLMHAINPWGMKYHRRVNANNVDLNRTFLWEASFDPTFNLEYDALNSSINPDQPVQNLALSNLSFYANLAWKVIQKGWPAFKHRLLLGQYRHTRGLFYGGEGYQEESRLLIDLYKQAFGAYDQILQLDMHTGYGPRYQMGLVNSALETKSSQEFEREFNYPLVVAANPEEFYAIQGDMIDYVYALRQYDFPEKKLYATSFEFGTLGNGLRGQVGSPRAMVLENQLHWRGAANGRSAEQIKHDFEELFNPADVDWRAKAVADAQQAFEGILLAEKFIQATEE